MLLRGVSSSISKTILLPFAVDIIEDLYSPRTASMDFVSELVRKRGKENLHKFIQFIVEVFKRLFFCFFVFFGVLQRMCAIILFYFL